MSEALVTIGLPFTRGGRHLELAIKSIFAQTFTNWHLFLVSDGAPARAVDLLRRIDDPRVRVLDDGTRRGLSARLNEIAQVAKTPTVARMDADDIMLPRRLQVQVEWLQSNPDTDVVGTRAILIDEEDRIVGAFTEPPIPSFSKQLFRNNTFTHPTILGRREWFLKHQYKEDYPLAEDKELWLRTWPVSNFAKLDERLFFYRVSRTLSPSKIRTTRRSCRRLTLAFGPSRLGCLGTTKRLVQDSTKDLVYEMALLTGRTDVIYKRKYTPLAAQTSAEYREILFGVAHHPVPGWPTS